MLYYLHEMSRLSMAPARAMSDGLRMVLNHPMNPMANSPMVRSLESAADIFEHLTRSYGKPNWDLDTTDIDGVAVEVEKEVVIKRTYCDLLHFKRAAEHKDPKLLIVAPLSGHYATLVRGTVEAMLPDHDVFITDWVDARMVPLSDGPFHFDDYVDYVCEWIRLLSPDLHVVSVCQPTVPVLAAVSLMASRDEPVWPKTMIMMGGPIDARKSPTAVNNLATKKPHSWFEQNVIERVPAKYPGFMRRVYPGFLQHLGFVAMNPDRHFNAHWDYYNHLLEGDGDSADHHRRFYDEYNAVLDMPAEYYLDTVKRVFQDFSLPKGRLFVREELVRPQSIRKTALFSIEGELDDISGTGQSEAAHALCLNIPAGQREHYLAPRVGHYGIFSGRRWREMIYPQIREFVRRHA